MLLLNNDDQKPRKKFSRILSIILIILIIGISVLLISVPGKEPQLSIYSDDWNDLSEFRLGILNDSYNISHISSTPIYLRELEKPTNTVFVIIGLEREYTQEEVNVINEYVNNGGNIILADDFSYGNSFIRKLDNTGGSLYYHDESIGYEFSNEKIVDIQYYKDPNYIMVNTATPDKFRVMLNSPTALVERSDIYDIYDTNFEYHEVLAQTSSMSWLDYNDNLSRDYGEPEGPFPIVMRFSKSAQVYTTVANRVSNIILISDPSIFINEMWDQADNKEFALFLINDLLKPGGEVIFDESVHLTEAGVTDLGNSFFIIIAYMYGNYTLIGLFLFITIITSILVPISRSKKIKNIYFRHKDLLDSKKIFIMRRPELDLLDYSWIRAIFMEKVRISYDIPHEIFHNYNKNQLADFLNDDELLEFVFLQPHFKMDRLYLYRIVQQIILWEPDPEMVNRMSDLIKKSGKFSISDSERAEVIFKKLDLDDLEARDQNIPVFEVGDGIEQNKEHNHNTSIQQGK